MSRPLLRSVGPGPSERPGSWARHLAPGASLPALGEASLVARWRQVWAAEPTRPVLLDGSGPAVSAAELEERSAVAAGRLTGLGLVAGDRLLVSATASVDLVVAYVAALRLGLVVVPVNTAYRDRELAHVMTDARPSAAVVDDASRSAVLSELGGDGFAVAGPDLDASAAATPLELDQVRPEDPALLLYTSGTTGAPKGALLSHANLEASAAALVAAWRWTPEDRLVLALPLFHLHGLGVGLHGSLLAGASVLLRPGFDPVDVVDSVHDHHASLFFGVPTMYRRLADGGRLEGLAPLRLCVSGSAPLSVELHDAVHAASGQRILERYGMTETVMNVSNPYDGERRPGTVGFPLPGVELRLADGSDEIWLRGPNVFGGYWERPEATAEVFADGWFRTGDVGAIDPDGYVRIVGRTKELIISGGYNVYPREVEDVLRRALGVGGGDVAVVGVADPEWGEAVVAFVEGDADLAALRAEAAAELAPYKRPKRIHRVDALPRNALGKVVRGDLHEP